MILFPPCKINLGLSILARRADGYHDIETLMYPVAALCDALELIPSDEPGVRFSTSGLPVEGAPEQNLCLRAYEAFRARHPIGGVRMHLHKVIPMGAGLGGGSSDAASVVRALNDLFEKGLPPGELESIAAEVGSDTAFFVNSRPAFAQGRGERLEPFDIDLRGYRLLIVKPPFGVSTAEAYAGVTPAAAEISLAGLLRQPVAAWAGTLTNDFEPSVFGRYPGLARLKEELYAAGALYASLSGSGSALFGLFPGGVPVRWPAADDLFVFQADLT